MIDQQEKERRQRKRPFVLVVIPGFPPQEPGRRMVWDAYGSMRWANVEAKRLRKQMPEFEWVVDTMSYLEAQKLRKKPFDTRGLFRRNRMA